LSTDPNEPPSGRPGDFGDLGPFTLERHEYVSVTKTPVHCFPVMLRGQLIGYLWAAESESADAAGFCPRLGTGGVGFDAGGRWRGRLKRARENGMSPLAAVRQWVGEPEDSIGGTVPADGEERVLPNSQAVQALASGRAE
jgi:hypothetical protein